MSSGTQYFISMPVLLFVLIFLSNCDSGSESDSQADADNLHQTVKQDDINATI